MGVSVAQAVVHGLAMAFVYDVTARTDISVMGLIVISFGWGIAPWIVGALVAGLKWLAWTITSDRGSPLAALNWAVFVLLLIQVLTGLAGFWDPAI